MFKRLPARVDPLRLADAGAQLEGTVPLKAMRRLAAAVVEGGDARVRLEFRRAGDGTPVVRGSIEAELALECQRCLEPVRWPVTARIELAMARSDAEAERLGTAYEPLLLEERTIDLAGLVEDEILLALPLVPRHEPAQCPASEHLQQPQTEPEEVDSRPNPFAVLSRLKQERDD